jgi:hypothetical protein
VSPLLLVGYIRESLLARRIRSKFSLLPYTVISVGCASHGRPFLVEPTRTAAARDAAKEAAHRKNVRRSDSLSKKGGSLSILRLALGLARANIDSRIGNEILN